jgi:hypothetical protein
VLIVAYGVAGLPMDMIEECMGDPEADADNDVLKTEQTVQVLSSGMLMSTRKHPTILGIACSWLEIRFNFLMLHVL